MRSAGNEHRRLGKRKLKYLFDDRLVTIPSTEDKFAVDGLVELGIGAS
jgi:hypothetical protein